MQGLRGSVKRLEQRAGQLSPPPRVLGGVAVVIGGTEKDGVYDVAVAHDDELEKLELDGRLHKNAFMGRFTGSDDQEVVSDKPVDEIILILCAEAADPGHADDVVLDIAELTPEELKVIEKDGRLLLRDVTVTVTLSPPW